MRRRLPAWCSTRYRRVGFGCFAMAADMRNRLQYCKRPPDLLVPDKPAGRILSENPFSSSDQVRGQAFRDHALSELDAGELDHLAPLGVLVGDQLAIVGGAHRHRY